MDYLHSWYFLINFIFFLGLCTSFWPHTLILFLYSFYIQYSTLSKFYEIFLFKFYFISYLIVIAGDSNWILLASESRTLLSELVLPLWIFLFFESVVSTFIWIHLLLSSKSIFFFLLFTSNTFTSSSDFVELFYMILGCSILHLY